MKKIFLAFLLACATLHATSQNEPDLSVRYIRRTPEINYVENSTNPTVQGWPAQGQQIQWRAHVKNWSSEGYTNIKYLWRKGGVVVKTGSVDFTPYSEETIVLDDTWSFSPDSLTLFIDSDQELREVTELNNFLHVYTTAISANFYVEQSLYDYFHQYQHELGTLTNSWDDWLQILQVRRWNQMFQDARFPEAPMGIIDRIRVDSIVVVPDRSLPLAGGLATNNPNFNDKTVDLQWGFPFTPELINAYSNHTRTQDDNPFFYEGSLLHELGHARYLIDLYAFDVSQPQVKIKEGNTLVAGSALMPIKGGDVVYYNKWQSLMSGTYNVISLYEVLAMNMIARRRAVCGNYNSPCNIGIYINDLPANNVVAFTDQDNNVIQNACVEIYHASFGDGWYGKDFDDVPDRQFVTDNSGRVNVGRNPFANRTLFTGFGFTNMDAIIRIEKNNRVGYAVLEAADFNVEYWKGNTTNANYTMKVNMLSCADFAGSNCVCAAVLPVQLKDFGGEAAAGLNKLHWQATADNKFLEFVVESSKDGIAFSARGSVAACTKPGEDCNYSFADVSQMGLTYYRLTQVDKDGQFTYSKTITIANETNAKARVSLSPNPVRDLLTVDLVVTEKSFIKLSIRNTDGKTLVRENAAAIRGKNSFKMNTSQLAQGIYFLSIEAPGMKQTLKVVKR